jgi:MFS family permease
MQATATTLDSETENVPVNSRNKVVVASLIGTAIEFFDFYIYATAAVIVFPHIFFPQGDPTAATLQSLATFAIAFVARPIGSALFGHFGDRVGRKVTLVASLLTMGISTVAIGLLPTMKPSAFWRRSCWRWRVLVRVWGWAVNGAARRCWRPKTPRAQARAVWFFPAAGRADWLLLRQRHLPAALLAADG